MSTRLAQTLTCPLCRAPMPPTPTSGRWECIECKATLIVGHQTLVQHWPEPAPLPPADPLTPEVGGVVKSEDGLDRLLGRYE